MGINWTYIGGYNHLAFTENMRAVVFVFVDLSWRRGLCAKKLRRGTAIGGEMAGSQAVDAGGSAAREGGRDACGGHGASIVVVRHLKVPVLVRDRRCLVGL